MNNKIMTKTKYELELETKLFKAWADTVLADFRRKEALEALIQLNNRVHSGYDFNADPDNITRLVGNVLADQQASNAGTQRPGTPDGPLATETRKPGSLK